MDRFKEFTTDECLLIKDGLYLLDGKLKEWGSKYPDIECDKDLVSTMMAELTDKLSL